MGFGLLRWPYRARVLEQIRAWAISGFGVEDQALTRQALCDQAQGMHTRSHVDTSRFVQLSAPSNLQAEPVPRLLAPIQDLTTVVPPVGVARAIYGWLSVLSDRYS